MSMRDEIPVVNKKLKVAKNKLTLGFLSIIIIGMEVVR